MKTPKLIMAIIAILLFSNLLFAADPLNGNADNLANVLTEKLSKDVQLTDSQKTIVKAKVIEFIARMESADKKSTDSEKFNAKKQASDEYESKLDSILTLEQKTQLKLKSTEREKAN